MHLTKEPGYDQEQNQTPNDLPKQEKYQHVGVQAVFVFQARVM